MGAEQSSMAGYAAVDVTEADKLHALIDKESPGKATSSPLSDLANKLNRTTSSSSSSAWKLPSSLVPQKKPPPPKALGDLDGDRTPPLCDASFSHGDREAVHGAVKAALGQQLEDNAAAGVAAEAAHSNNNTAMLMERAVLDRDGAAVRRLLQREDASLKAQTAEGLAPLHVAAAAGHADMVGVLAVLGAGPNAATRDARDTPLHLAAAGGGLNAAGRQECLALLLGAAGACADLPDRDGRTAMHVAAMTGNVPALTALLAAGAHRASVDKDGMRPVDLAQAANAAEAVRYLDARDTRVQADKLKLYGQWLA